MDRANDDNSNLTDKWKECEAQVRKGYAILTNEIYESGFGLSTKNYKIIKGLHQLQT